MQIQRSRHHGARIITFTWRSDPWDSTRDTPPPLPAVWAQLVTKSGRVWPICCKSCFFAFHFFQHGRCYTAISSLPFDSKSSPEGELFKSVMYPAAAVFSEERNQTLMYPPAALRVCTMKEKRSKSSPMGPAGRENPWCLRIRVYGFMIKVASKPQRREGRLLGLQGPSSPSPGRWLSR